MKITSQMNYAGNFTESLAEVGELEKAGLDSIWIAEAYGFDAARLKGW